MPKFSKKMHKTHIANPYQDIDFANYQLQCGKAKSIEKVNDQIVYFFPLFKDYTISYTDKPLTNLNQLAKKHNSIYTIIENTSPLTSPQKNKKAIREIIPRFTSIIDLQKSEEDILKNMHSKGRYNIRLAEKHNLTIQKSTSTKEFYQILEKTAKRDKFYINPPQFYQTMLDTLQPKGKAKLFLAYHPNHKSPIAGMLNTYIEDTATYFYGASDHEYRKYMAPYLLQWHAIQDAKQNNFKTYDFLGIANPNNPKDPLNGVTNFKSKFGGQNIQYSSTQIIIHKPLLYTLLKIKKILKG